MFSNNVQVSGTIAGGISINGTISRQSEGIVGQSVSIPAAEQGALTTRTGDTSGTLTMDSGGHTITTGATVDVFWNGGRRYNVVVGTVSGTSVPLTISGSGDVLPAQDTVVTVSIQQVIEFTVDGSNLKMILAKMASIGRIGFYEASTEEVSIDLAKGEPWFWASDMDLTNPLAATIVDQIGVTQKSTVAVAFSVGAAYDSTP